MPKEMRVPLSSPRASPYLSSSSSGSSSYRRHSSSLAPPNHLSGPSVAAASDFKEFQEVRCPVCIEPPHNAVLLLCSSRDKGCRPFMCNTSHRHSNCLWQYRKSLSALRSAKDLTCPLCRGAVTDWAINEPARKYMNNISRSCSLECCEFVGSYRELRRHVRQEHPTLRPSEADPVRQGDWRRIEEEQDFNDLMRIMQSELSQEQDVARMEELQGLDEWFSLLRSDNFQEDVSLGTPSAWTFMASQTAFTIHRTGAPPAALLRSLASAIRRQILVLSPNAGEGGRQEAPPAEASATTMRRWVLIPLPNAGEGGRQGAPPAVQQGQGNPSWRRQVITSDVEVDGDVEGGRQAVPPAVRQGQSILSWRRQMITSDVEVVGDVEGGRQEAPPAIRQGPSTLSWRRQVITLDDDADIDSGLNPTGI